MHEMGIVLQIVKTAEEYAKTCGAVSVHRLTLQVGEASAVVAHYVESFWKDVVPDHPVLAECELEIEEIPAKAFCMDCGEVFYPGDSQKLQYEPHSRAHQLVDVCPKCGSGMYKLIEGNTMMIKSMEIE